MENGLPCMLLGYYQVFKDALKATLTRMQKVKNHSYNLLYRLCGEMYSRGIECTETIFTPSSQEELNAILKLITGDLNNIKIQKKK